VAPIGTEAGTKVLVTGASGFVGRQLCARLAASGYAVRCATRSGVLTPPLQGFDAVNVGELGVDTDWSQALSDISIVFHLAARTHVLRETAGDALANYRRINVEGTRTLAQAAIRAGVRRIVFLSSIKVNGEQTNHIPFDEDMTPRPEDAYGVSKWEAEQVLHAITRDGGVESVILRSPLVYGPGAKGNFLRLMHWIVRGVPLPLASINNRRSLIFVENLVDALIAAGGSPAAVHRTYLVSDGDDLSTPELIRSIAGALRVQARLFPVPPELLMAAATVLRIGEEMRRLTGSLQIDSSRICHESKWIPRFPPAEGFARTAQWYYSQFPSKSNT
jgi:nucleoside-diphosphate-sugar epimerase